MGHMIEIDTDQDSLNAYAVWPKEGKGTPIILLQEYWGLVDQIKGVADRLAEEGFAVLIPDLYGGKLTDDPKEAANFMQQLDPRKAANQVASAIHYLKVWEVTTGAEIGCVGFCMGGGLALCLAMVEPKISAFVVYYGAIPWDEIVFDGAAVKSPVLLHYGTDDQWATLDMAQEFRRKIEDSGGDVTLYVYGGAEHAFLDETRPASFDPKATDQSWERTVTFLQNRLAVAGEPKQMDECMEQSPGGKYGDP